LPRRRRGQLPLALGRALVPAPVPPLGLAAAGRIGRRRTAGRSAPPRQLPAGCPADGRALAAGRLAGQRAVRWHALGVALPLPDRRPPIAIRSSTYVRR